jgi:hypothetical protein
MSGGELECVWKELEQERTYFKWGVGDLSQSEAIMNLATWNLSESYMHRNVKPTQINSPQRERK